MKNKKPKGLTSFDIRKSLKKMKLAEKKDPAVVTKDGMWIAYQGSVLRWSDLVIPDYDKR